MRTAVSVQDGERDAISLGQRQSLGKADKLIGPNNLGHPSYLVKR